MKVASLSSVALLVALAELPAQTADPVLARLPADAATVLVVRDPLPSIEQLLRAPQIVELLHATAPLQERVLGRHFEAAQIAALLRAFRDYVPVGGGLGIDAASLDGLTELGRVALLANVLRLAGAEPGAASPTVMAVRRLCAAALAQLRTPTGSVVATLRNERMSENWFDALVDAVQPMAKDPACHVELVDTTLTVRFDPFALADGALRRMLVDGGVEVPANLALPIVLRLQQQGVDWTLQIGAPSAGPLPPAAMGAGWREEAEQVLFLRVDLSRVAAAITSDVEAIAELADDRPALQTLALQSQAFLEQAEGWLAPSTARVRLADGLETVSEIELGGETAGLTSVQVPPARLLRCVRPDDGPFQVTSFPAPVLIAGALGEVRGRIARKGQAVPCLDALFACFDADEALEVFDWGAVVVSSKAAFRGAPGWQAGPMPFASVAVLGVLEDGEDGAEFLAQVDAACSDALGCRSICDSKDLGLGVPAQVLRLELLPASLGEGLDADWAPHWFVVDGVLVASTDIALSRELITRLRDEHAAPAPALPAGRVVFWSLWQSAHMAAILEGVVRWLDVLPDAKAALADFMALGAAAVRAIDRFETVTVVDGSVLRTRFDLRLAKLPAGK